MKRIASLLLGVVVWISLCGFGGGGDPPTKSDVAAERLETVFNASVLVAAYGHYARAYNMANHGRKEALVAHIEIPEKYTALMKVLATLGVSDSVAKIRELYYQGKQGAALKLANASVDVLETEGLFVPDDLAHLHHKLKDWRLELFLLMGSEPLTPTSI